MTEDTTRKALEKLASALLGLDPIPADVSRMDLIEEAISYAMISMGKPVDHEAIVDGLDALSVQILVDKMDKAGKDVLHIEVNDDEDEHVVTVLGLTSLRYADAALDAIEDLLNDDEEADNEVTSPGVKKTDYSIN